MNPPTLIRWQLNSYSLLMATMNWIGSPAMISARHRKEWASDGNAETKSRNIAIARCSFSMAKRCMVVSTRMTLSRMCLPAMHFWEWWICWSATLHSSTLSVHACNNLYKGVGEVERPEFTCFVDFDSIGAYRVLVFLGGKP